MKTLEIDIETFSDIDLLKTGVYRYSASPLFAIQIFCYSINDKPVKRIDLMAGEKIPKKVVRMIKDPNVIKYAHNAQFERVCLGVHLGERLSPKNWRCTAVWARYLGLPSKLELGAEAIAKATGQPIQQKDKEGRALISYFAKPCKPTKVNGGRTQNLPEHAPERWEMYLSYCEQDVRTEASMRKFMERYPMSPELWLDYEIDQDINDRGVPIDMEFMSVAIEMVERIKAKASKKLYKLTGVEKSTLLGQLKKWALTQGYELTSLSKDVMPKLLADPDVPKKVHKMLKLVELAGGSSVSKYTATRALVLPDNRVHGILQYYGAGTGRWAGRGLQPQNLPRNYLKDMATAKELALWGDESLIEGFEGNTAISVLTQLVRTIIQAEDGREFDVSDLSAIEARVTAWYANEAWVLEVFRGHGMIYEATADRMYKLGGVENVSKADRQKGKQATLALGYGGGANAMIAMGALDQGIKQEELEGIKKQWRGANKNICNLWYDVEATAKHAIRNPGKAFRCKGSARDKLSMRYDENKVLQIKLASGRCISYFDCKIGQNGIEYLNASMSTGLFKTKTWGGKLVENIVQATARDVMAEIIRRIEQRGLEVAFHVHDEVIVHNPIGTMEPGELDDLLAIVPDWAEGLPLNAEGFKTKFYMKD